MNAAEIAAALGKPRREGREWRCTCPCHNDRDPSLSLTENDGKLLVICRAGCDQDTVIAEMKRRGLWGNGHDRTSRMQIDAVYDYTDERGTVLFQVCRLYPKDFRQRRPDGTWSTEGVRKVPYHLDELVAARGRANGTPWRVYVTEGEKDADRLRKQWGLTATTNPGGAGKWRSAYNQHFAGADAVVIPDNDDAGRQHAEIVARNLAPVAANVRIAELPGLAPKGDVSDWLGLNGDATQSDFEELVEQVAQPEPAAESDSATRNGEIAIYDAGDIDVTKIQPRQWLLGVSFCRKFISGLIGAGTAGKTTVRYPQYLSMATQRNLTGEHVHVRGRVLIACLEDDLDEIRRRIGAAMLHHRIAPQEVKGWVYYCCPRGLKLLRTRQDRDTAVGELYTELQRTIKELKIDLLSIDPFIKAHGVEENDNNSIDQVCIMLATLGDEFNCAVDINSHARKGEAVPGDAERDRGASSKKDAGRLMRTIGGMSPADAELFKIPTKDIPAYVRVDDAKVNITPKSTQAMWFKLVDVVLGNTEVDPLYPHGDHVATAERWYPPDVFGALDNSTINRILDRIEAGPYEGGRYSPTFNAKARSVLPVMQEFCPELTDEQAKHVIKTWLRTGVLIKRDHEDPKDRHDHPSLFVGKRPGDTWER